MAIRRLLVDDEAVVRQERRLVRGPNPAFEIVDAAAAGARALALTRHRPRVVVLIDLLLPVRDGTSVTTPIRPAWPDTAASALTSGLEDDQLVGAVQTRAIGSLLTDDEPGRAVTAAAAGQVPVLPWAASLL